MSGSGPAPSSALPWEPVIGLEVHAQLRTRTKLFCSCRADFGDEPNTNVCPICLGHPGVLPVLNAEAVRLAARVGLGLHCELRSESVFARKNYFYPDLPKGYQVSQLDRPICRDGWLGIRIGEGARSIGIERAHLEEDAGKSIHDPRRGVSLVDYNRAGVPLLEIVSRPELHTAQEAVAYLKELRGILRYLDACDGNLEQGSFRCDANVSLRPRGTEAFGTRVEVKNINSFRNVGRALDFEIQRQARVLDRGSAVVQETRLFDADRGRTEAMRSKEESCDYRYFPDPDLLPVALPGGWLEELRRALPELPHQLRERFASTHGLRPREIEVLVDDRDLASYFEAVVGAGADPVAASKWIATELLGRLAAGGGRAESIPVPPDGLGRLMVHLGSGAISGKMAKEIFARMWRSGADPDAEVASLGAVIGDESELEAICRAVVEAAPAEAERYRAGKARVFGWFMGQIMKQTRGKADPRKAGAALRRILGEAHPPGGEG